MLKVVLSFAMSLGLLAVSFAALSTAQTADAVYVCILLSIATLIGSGVFLVLGCAASYTRLIGRS